MIGNRLLSAYKIQPVRFRKIPVTIANEKEMSLNTFSPKLAHLTNVYGRAL